MLLLPCSDATGKRRRKMVRVFVSTSTVLADVSIFLSSGQARSRCTAADGRPQTTEPTDRPLAPSGTRPQDRGTARLSHRRTLRQTPEPPQKTGKEQKRRHANQDFDRKNRRQKTRTKNIESGRPSFGCLGLSSVCIYGVKGV